MSDLVNEVLARESLEIDIIEALGGRMACLIVAGISLKIGPKKYQSNVELTRDG